MKQPFDLNYYLSHPDCKVETRDGKHARIICTDKCGGSPLVVLVGGNEEIITYNTNGTTTGQELSLSSDLFIVTDEPELSAFEQRVLDVLEYIDEGYYEAAGMEVHQSIKDFAIAFSAELLSLAREQLIQEGYIIEKKAFHDAVEKVEPENKLLANMSLEYSLHAKVEDGTRRAVISWKEFQKVAQKFYDMGKKDALKVEPEVMKEVEEKVRIKTIDELKKQNEFKTWLHIVDKVLTDYNGIGQYLDNSDCHRIAEELREKYCFDDTSSDWDRIYRKGLEEGTNFGYNKALKEQKSVEQDVDDIKDALRKVNIVSCLFANWKGEPSKTTNNGDLIIGIDTVEMLIDANRILQNYNREKQISVDAVEKVEPEVMKKAEDNVDKVNEGEKIRKWLLGLIKSNEYGPISNVGDMPCPKLKVLAWLEKQKEQEPVDEMEIIKKHITRDSLSEEANKRLEECGWYVTDDKPAEWSAKDKQMLRNCIDALREGATGNAIVINYGEHEDWLKNLPERFNFDDLKDYEDKLDRCACDNFNKGFQAGKEKVLKDLPRWRKVTFQVGYGVVDISNRTQYDYINRNGYLLNVGELEKLPGFKEE